MKTPLGAICAGGYDRGVPYRNQKKDNLFIDKDEGDAAALGSFFKKSESAAKIQSSQFLANEGKKCMYVCIYEHFHVLL